MSYLVVDVEGTTKNKGHPFTPSNKLCAIGIKNETIEEVYPIEYGIEPYGDRLASIQQHITEYGHIVGFNVKFDLHWLRRYGIDFSSCWVHDCQLAYFLEVNQSVRYPSLNEAAAHYGLSPKLDVVATEYWAKGIDTPDVPWQLLDEYNRQDIRLTEAIYQKQIKWLDAHPKLKRLFRLQCQDLMVLEEMEWNGLLYDKEQSRERLAGVDLLVGGITRDLDGFVSRCPVNWNSVDHVSAVLYGGVIEEHIKEPFLFTYKDEKRAPQWKERWTVLTHHLPRLVEPLPNTSLAKEGKWQTGGPVLKELRPSHSGPAASIISLLLELADLAKLRDYYSGIPELMDTMGWTDGYLHGNLNQCSVVTGRLSSNKPNLQNMPEVVHELILSRFQSRMTGMEGSRET